MVVVEQTTTVIPGLLWKIRPGSGPSWQGKKQKAEKKKQKLKLTSWGITGSGLPELSWEPRELEALRDTQELEAPRLQDRELKLDPLAMRELVPAYSKLDCQGRQKSESGSQPLTW